MIFLLNVSEGEIMIVVVHFLPRGKLIREFVLPSLDKFTECQMLHKIIAYNFHLNLYCWASKISLQQDLNYNKSNTL